MIAWERPAQTWGWVVLVGTEIRRPCCSCDWPEPWQELGGTETVLHRLPLCSFLLSSPLLTWAEPSKGALILLSAAGAVDVRMGLSRTPAVLMCRSLP